MTIDQIREARRIAEERVAYILQTLEGQTGLSVKDMALVRFDVTRFDDAHRRLVISGVTIQMELSK